MGGGNAVVLDVEDVVKAPDNVSALLDMTSAGTLRVRGNFSLVGGEVTGGTGTIEFAGTGRTVSSGSAIFNNVTVTGSYTLAVSFYFQGALDVQSGGSFSGAGSTFLRPRNGASITGSGTKSFGRVEINSGMAVTASGNFSVSTVFTVDGAFTPTAATVISGTGTLNGTGTIKVTRTGTNALGNQYTMTTLDTTTNTVEYNGASNQVINSRTFKNLTINNPVSVQINNGNITVTGVMNFAQGLVMGAGNEIVITNSAPSAVVQGTGWTRLIIHRTIGTGTNTYLYPLGTGSVSQPVSVTFHNVTVAGLVNMQGVTNSPNGVGGGSGLDPSRDVGNVWRFTVETATFATCDVTINFGTSYDVGADPTKFVLRRTSGVDEPWNDIPATNTATSITITGQALSGQNFLATGNQEIDHYVVAAGSPQSAGTPFTTTVTAQDVLNVTANNSTTVVTMTSSTGHVQFDSDGNGTFGDNTKTLTNGVFTISTRDNTIESVTITATANTKTGSITISVNLGPPSGATTTIDATPTTIAANGRATSAITVQVRDAAGNSYSSSAGTLVLMTTLGTLDAVTDNNNGTYSSTLRTGTVGGTATVSGTISATSITDTAVVTFTSVPFGTPADFAATATSITQVQLSWAGVGGGMTYEVYRSSLNGPYTLLVSTTNLDAFDNTVSANTTYLYKVRAVGTGGTSAFGAVDPATTVIFTDTSPSGVLIKPIHITQLRTAVNAMRAAAGLTASTFTDPSLVTGNSIKAVHVTELRTAVDAARNAIGLALPNYTDPTVTAAATAVKAAHLVELRQRVQ